MVPAPWMREVPQQFVDTVAAEAPHVRTSPPPCRPLAKVEAGRDRRARARHAAPVAVQPYSTPATAELAHDLSFLRIARQANPSKLARGLSFSRQPANPSEAGRDLCFPWTGIE